MSKKPPYLNKKFKTVSEKLEFIQKQCKEVDIFPELKQLFKDKGYEKVIITHGNTEFGKDLMLCKYDKDLKENKWTGVIVKNKKATQNDFLQGNEIGNQITTAFNVPYKDEKGDEIYISTVIIVINGAITGNATEVIRTAYTPTIKNNISLWNYQRLADEFDEYSKEIFLNNLDPNVSHYQNQLIKELSNLENNSFFDLKINDINEIFVNVQTTYSKEIKKLNEYVTYDSSEKKLFKDEDIEGSSEILNSKSNFIIHGIPTSGKTIFLKRIGIKALLDDATNYGVFYFELDKVNTFNIVDLIEKEYVRLCQENFDSNNFDKIIVLLDSFDFVNDEVKRQEIIEYIEKLSKDEKYQIIITTRDIDYLKTSNHLKEFKETELLPFNLGQALKLVRKIIPDNEVKTNNFVNAIKESLLDSSIQKTPFALTLLAVLYRDEQIDLKELPANIFELYNRFTDVYLDRWDANKGITQLYKYEQTKIIISFIALELHRNGLNSICIEHLSKLLKDLRKTYTFTELDDTEKYIDFLKTKSGVFYYDENNKCFTFFNHFFQEFFTSLAIEDDNEEIFIDKIYDQWWHNSLIFYAGKNPKSYKIHRSLIDNVLPIDLLQRLMYLNQHSKSLQASHAITIPQRLEVVENLLFQYNKMFRELYTDASENENGFLNQFSLVSVINQSKGLFDNFFSSKHVATVEIIKYFESQLLNDNLELITKYNLAYFISSRINSYQPLENFAKEVLVKDDAVWSRIIYVDISFLKYKKTVNQKLLTRIKRKMNKNKFLIQYKLKSSLYDSK